MSDYIASINYLHYIVLIINLPFDSKVGDFGLAKLVDRTDDENFIATRLVGTPGYLPPE